MHNIRSYDFIVIGSGFGGSVSALRLSQKKYSVLVLEQGRRFAKEDFPKTNWDLRRWLWIPKLRFLGPFRMSLFKNMTVYSGVGVGGGSLVYANTLAVPKEKFFAAQSWSHLANWKVELAPYYEIAKRMLGVTTNPHFTATDRLMAELADDIGLADKFEAAEVGIYFGKSGLTRPDPYFDGQGPERTGCTFCGACMTGCRVGAKNTLDRNYLYLAEKFQTKVEPLSQVSAVRPNKDGGYLLTVNRRLGWLRSQRETLHAQQVIFAGGVLGTVDLLLNMQADPNALPNLSKNLGQHIRTNNESIIGVISDKPEFDFSTGIAISSIIHTDENSHIEPVRYGKGSGFFRLLMAPHAPGSSVRTRLTTMLSSFMKQPLRWMNIIFRSDFSRQTQILLYMQSLESTLRFKLKRRPWLGFRKSMGTTLGTGGEQPQAFIKEATALAARFAQKTNGLLANVFTESIFGIASTAHVLGGCCMGKDRDEGVIDTQHRIHGYPGLYVIDGSAVSANPGVNPSLTITALAERAMSYIPEKNMAQVISGAEKPSKQDR